MRSREGRFGGRRAPRGARAGAAVASVLVAGALVSSAAEPWEEAARRAEVLLADGNVLAAEGESIGLLDRAVELAPPDRTRALPEAMSALGMLGRIVARTGGHARTVEVLERWAALGAAGPAEAQVAALARWMAGHAKLSSSGSREAADSVWAPLGFLDSWRVIGPFDNERGGGFSTRYPPEKELHLDGVHDGKKRKVSWRELPARPLAGRLDLSALLDPDQESLAYLLAAIETDRPAEAVLWISSDEGYRAWLNGKLVGSEDIHRALRFDQTGLRISLEKGRNWLLVKVPQTTGPWGFAARLASWPGLGPLDGWRQVPPAEALDPPAVAEDGAAAAPIPSPVLALLDARLAGSPADARALYLQGRILHDTRSHDRGTHPDTEAIAKAVEIDPSQAAWWLELARSHERDTTIEAQRDDTDRRAALERAATAGSAEAERLLAEHYADTFGSWTRALSHVGAALARNPSSEGAITLRGRLEAELRFPRAEERAREAAWKLPARSPELRLSEARSRLERGAREEGESLVREVLAADATDAGARHLLADALLRAGRVDDAMALLGDGAALEPFATGWRERMSRIAEGAGRLSDALREVETALRIEPESQGLLRRKAELQLRTGDAAAALATLETAIALQPNLPDVREYIEYLRASASRFEDAFRRDVAGTIRDARTRTGNEAGDPARVLLDLTAVEVHRDGTTKQFQQQVVHVLNDRGIRMFDRFSTYYAAGEQVLEFKKATVHHADGRTSEARLSRYGGGETESSGYRGAAVDLPPLAVGDILEVELIREDVKQSFFGDYFGWQEVFQESLPIDDRAFVLRVPAGRTFHFHQRNMSVEPRKEVDEAGGTVTWTWELKDLPKLDPEPGMPPPKEVGPTLEVSTFESWEAFGRWYWNLVREQYEVSPEISRKVQELTSGAETELDRIRAIYGFVVTEVRYNAWEFGVHGFKPYNAATIFSRRFGDCKDKATLLSVMLGEAGIKAWPVIIRGDNQRGEEDLTLPIVNHFNHCISYVPEVPGRGELWLDGTASFHSIDELPAMDRGAKVLVVRDDGGEIRQIPWNDPEDLSHTEEITATLRPDLGASLQIRARPVGEYAAAIRQSFEIPSQRQTEMERAYGGRFAGVSVKGLDVSDLSRLDEPVSFSLDLDVPRFAEEASAGLRLPAPEDFFSTGQQLRGIGSLETRTRDIILGSPRRSTLRAVYVIPRELRLKSLPAEKDVSTRFGRLRVTYRQEGDTVHAERLLELTTPRIPVADYPAFRDFAAAVTRLEDERILLERGA